MTLRLAWLATAKGTGSKLLFERAADAIDAGQLDATIGVVFCNRERGQSVNTDAFLDLVESRGVPLVTLSSGDWRKRVGGAISQPGQPLAAWRSDYEQAVHERINAYDVQAGVLAGFMLIMPSLCQKLPLLNLHPALPQGPVGTWQEVIRRLIDSDADESGMMLQRSTPLLDRGPVVASCRYPLRGADLDELWADRQSVKRQSADHQAARRQAPANDDEPLFAAIRRKGVVREPHFLIASLQAIAQDRIAIPDVSDSGPNLDLTSDVEAALGGERPG